uniref:Solute-binding protein family 5 domain-containing protein n=1 Tax=Corethron hystrix TaxID=216773 RepID=A0A7S1G047_9STRA
MEGQLKTKHGWYGIPLVTEDWSCNGDFEFVIRTNTKHGPYLQELTFIRPIRMISPNAFVGDSKTANSCQLAWGTFDDKEFNEEVVCAGIAGIYGTGPFSYESRETISTEDGEYDKEVVFVANGNYWGGAPAIQRLVVQYYETSAEVKTALLNGSLDLVWGSGVLSDADIYEIENDNALQKDVQVFHSGDLQNVILILNSGQAPFDDIEVRKTVIHSINKVAFVQKELKGLQQVVDNIFPLEAPFCNVDLTPRWDYDFQKAVLLSLQKCGMEEAVASSQTNNNLAMGLGWGLGIGLLVMISLATFFYKRTRKLEVELGLQKGAEAL